MPGSESRRAAEREAVGRMRLLWEARRFLARSAAAGLAVAAGVAFLIPPRYESTTQVMPPDAQSTAGLALAARLAGQDAGALGGLAGDLLGMKSTGALFVGVLRSRTVEDRIIARFALRKVYGAKLEKDAREKLEARTSIGEDRKSGIISVTAADRDPQRAAAIAGAYIDALDAMMAELTTSSAHRERVFLEERLAGAKGDLEGAEKEFSQFASRNATVDITAQGKAMVEGAAALEGQMIAAQSELESLRQIYTDDNVRVRSTQARIRELRRELGRLGGQAESDAPGGDERASGAYPTLRQLPLLGVAYADLYRRLKLEEAVFETLTEEYELAKVQEAKEIPTVKVLDAAEVPEKRSFPPRLGIVVTGTVSALLSGAVWLLATAHWKEIDPADPGKQLAAEIFETVRDRLRQAPPRGSRAEAPAAAAREQPAEGIARIVAERRAEKPL